MKNAMRMIKKVFMSMAIMLCVFSSNVIMAEAATTYKDAEPNDSATEAQFISRNAMTATNKVSTSMGSTYRYVQGTLSGDDEDWYRVNLCSNDENYFTITGGTGRMYIQILDSANNEIAFISYFNSNTSEHVFRIDVPENDMYYVRIYHSLSSTNSSYRFLIGEPEYVLDSYTHDFGSQTLVKKKEWISDEINFGEISDIPNRSIVYKIALSGCTTSVSSKRCFKNEFYDSWVATRTGYTYNLAPTEDAARANQEWQFKYVSSATANKTITPKVTLQYVYPKLPANEQ